MLAPRPTPKLEDHPSSAVRGCLFNLFTATLHIGGRSSNRNPRTRHAVVTGTHIHKGLCCKLHKPFYVAIIPSSYHNDLKYFAITAICLASCGQSALPKRVAGVDGTDTVSLRVTAGRVSTLGKKCLCWAYPVGH